jgi:selenide,water dikinase
VGFETNDDAGVFKIRDDFYLVETVDIITPVVDDPYTFGRISAINSLSDIYAMGAKPLTALSVLMYSCDIDTDIISKILQGAADELAKVHCTLVGGHTVSDSELKFGLAVTGYLENEKFYRNCTLREDDIIIYTKPLGIGILSTALKGELLSKEDEERLTDTMLLSNYRASEVIRNYDVSGVTDVTGFGLGGHLFEMAKGSDKTVEVYIENLHFLPSTLKFADMGIIPGGAYLNKQYMIYNYEFLSSEKEKEILLFDPQTSGGLLIGVKFDDAEKLVTDLRSSGYEDAAIIGSVTKLSDKYLFFK